MEHRPLLLKINRFLGAYLVEKKLITDDVLEQANDRLLDLIQESSFEKANLLNVLVHDLGALEANNWDSFVLESNKVGVIDLENYNLSTFIEKAFSMEMAWGTLTIPFDYVEGFYWVASSLYPCDPVRKHWETLLEEKVIWYYTSLQGTISALDRVKPSEDAAPISPDKVGESS